MWYIDIYHILPSKTNHPCTEKISPVPWIRNGLYLISHLALTGLKSRRNGMTFPGDFWIFKWCWSFSETFGWVNFSQTPVFTAEADLNQDAKKCSGEFDCQEGGDVGKQGWCKPLHLRQPPMQCVKTLSLMASEPFCSWTSMASQLSLLAFVFFTTKGYCTSARPRGATLLYFNSGGKHQRSS